jgi:hypothetical protein
MKKHITINIGLETIQGDRLDIHHAIREIERAGVSITVSGVVAGEWEGKPEQTLVIGGWVASSPELWERLCAASRALNQAAIAVWRDGLGELIGDTAAPFNSELFHFHLK